MFQARATVSPISSVSRSSRPPTSTTEAHCSLQLNTVSAVKSSGTIIMGTTTKCDVTGLRCPHRGNGRMDGFTLSELCLVQWHTACVICAQLIPGYLKYDCSLLFFSAIVSYTRAVTQKTISQNSSNIWWQIECWRSPCKPFDRCLVWDAIRQFALMSVLCAAWRPLGVHVHVM